MRRWLLLLWLPSLAFGQDAYYGTTATSIRLSESANPEDLQRLAVHTGEVITPENIRASIQALFDSGRYRGVEVDAVSSPSGTELTFTVSPHQFFGTFVLKPENLLDRPLSTLLRLPVGQKFSEARVQEIVEETKALLEDAGYFNPVLTIVTGPDNPFHIRNIELDAPLDVHDKARIADVRIQGGEEVLPIGKLRDAFHVSPGDPYNSDEIDKGRSELQKEFLDRNFLNTRVDITRAYNADTNQVRLTVDIVPGQKTLIDTGGQISEEEVRNLVPIFEEGSFDPDLIREGRARIIEYLQQQGYFEATVDGPEIIPATPENPARVVFSINKGDRHSVKSVEFRGNTVFTDAQLQSRIKVHPGAFPRLLNRGIFTDELARGDVIAIQNMYRRSGYETAFAEVHNEDNPDHRMTVVFTITENDRVPISRVVFTGNSEMSEPDLRAAISVKEGDLYSPADADNARTVLTRLYYQSGYPDARIDVTADRDEQTGGKVVTYHISEGGRYRIGQILIAGNTRTAEKFIRRTSGLEQYVSWYDPEKILDAQQRLYATGLFRHVDIVPLDVDTGELRTVLIQIEEGQQITLTYGVGVKEYTGPRATFDIVHSNVFGGNRALGFRIRWGVHERQFQTTYHEPRLFNHESLDGYGTFTVERVNRLTFESSGVELALQVRKKLSANKSFLTTASYQTINLREVKLSEIVRSAGEPEGIIQIARLGESFISDTRDDAVDPHSGIFTTSTFQVASKAWGSEVNFLSVFNQSTYQKRSGNAVLAFSARVGWKIPYGETSELPITERYFAGGSTTLRGFGLDEAGPPGGGQLLTIGNAEYRVPMKTFSVGELGGVIFYDTGSVFEHPAEFSVSDFKHNAGVGLRFKTPLGPIRFDVGFNLFPKTRLNAQGVLEREERTHLFVTLGHTF